VAAVRIIRRRSWLFLVVRCVAVESSMLLQKLELPDGEILIGSLVSQDDTTYGFPFAVPGRDEVKKTGRIWVRSNPLER